MTDYTLAIRASAKKDLDALPDPVFDRIDPKIKTLATNPRPRGCKKLKGYKQLWRIRVGDYRIVYEVDDSLQLVKVVRIAHRSDAYDL